MIRFLLKKRTAVLIVMIGMIITTNGEAQLIKLRRKKPEQAPVPNFPVREQDEVWVVSTRSIRPSAFQTTDLTVKLRKDNQWVESDIKALIKAHQADKKRAIIYAHGNRQNASWAEYRGLQGYCLLLSESTCGPVRYVIWDWPSQDCGQPVRAYVPTVNRAAEEGFAMAWFLNQLQSPERTSLFGYSLGTQVIVSALQLLPSEFGNQSQFRTGILAPVTACRWPISTEQMKTVYAGIESLHILYSSQDYAVRAYRTGCGWNKNGGNVGIERLAEVDCENKICKMDVSAVVGNSHGIQEYFSCKQAAQRMICFLADCDCPCVDCECPLCRPCRSRQTTPMSTLRPTYEGCCRGNSR